MATLIGALILLLLAGGPSLAQPVTSAGTWAAFPNSALRPAMGAAPWNPTFLFDYSGGWFDEERQELGVWGGGHGDYPGNEVCTFPLAAGAWTCGPRSAWVTDPTTEQTADGHPSARHTYSCIARVNVPGWDGFFCHGGSLWRLGWPTAAAWFYHRDTATWERLPDRPAWGDSDYGRTSLATYAVFDEARGKVLVRSRNKCMGYAVVARAWTWEGACPYIENNASAAFDAERRVLVVLGGGVFEAWDTSTVPWTPVAAVLGGDQTPKAAQGTGLVFDPVGKRYVAHAGGSSLYFVDRDTWAVTKTLGGGADPGPAYASSGNMGRFRYVAKTRGLVVVSSIDTNVFYYQLGDVLPPPPPPPPPPTTVDIPEKTWVLLPLPPPAAGISNHDKHVSLAVNPDNGRVYFEGGDYYGQSYRQETWSLDVAARLASTNAAAGWALEYPYCGPSTQVQPKGTDFVGWTWDSIRHLFWMVPGEMQPHGNFAQRCPGEIPDSYTTDGNLIFRHVMTFDPAARAWSDVVPHGLGGDTWAAVHDPKTDTIVHARKDYVMGVYAVAAKTWTWFPHANVNVATSQWATDLEKRRIFMVDPGRQALLRWDMDAHALTQVGTTPCVTPTTTGQTDKGYLAWDSNAKVVLQVCYNRTGAWAYHPDETPPRWEDLSALPVVGTQSPPQMNGLTFDPVRNWLVGIGWDGIWLFRYGQAAAPQPPPPPACGGPGQPTCPCGGPGQPVCPPPPLPQPRIDIQVTKPVGVDVYVNGQRVQ